MSDDGTGETDAATAGGIRRQDREQQWRDRVSAWKASGLTQAAYCRGHGLAPAEFSWWKHELARRDQKPSVASSPKTTPRIHRPPRAFIPVRISPSPAREGFELLLRGGQTIRMGASFDETGLRRLLNVLENSQC